jgi:hypothetical protein
MGARPIEGTFANMPNSVAPPPGFYEDASGRRRWWDGNAWTEHSQPAAEAEPEASTSVLTEAQRRAVLERAVDAYVQEGYKLESLSSWQAVVTRRQRVRVGVNVLLTVITAGFWLLILALRLLNWPVDRAVLTIDADGNLGGAFSS